MTTDPRIAAAARVLACHLFPNWPKHEAEEQWPICIGVAEAVLAAADRAAWRPIGEARNGERVVRWHRVWDCPVAVEHNEQFGADMPWIEATKTTRWPEEAFTPHYQPLPAPPDPEDKADD